MAVTAPRMTQRRDDGNEAVRAACWALVVWLFVLTPGLTARSMQDVAESDLADSRAALVEGVATEYELGRHVATLLAADDLETLRILLTGGHPVVPKVIMETLAFDDDLRFVQVLLELASSAESPASAEQARMLVHDQALKHEQVRNDLVAMLTDVDVASDVAAEVQVTIMGALGRTRDLTVVPALLAHIEGPNQAAVLAAFEQLSGHRLPVQSDPLVFWTELWTRQQQEGLTRDVLLEEGHAAQRAGWAASNRAWNTERIRLRGELKAREREVAQARIEAMGKMIDRLIVALDDEYADVRKAAAQRLDEHLAHEKAGVAIPLLLERLGHGGEPGGTNGTHPEARIEENPEVRAAMVSALGSLGRDRPAVMTCLLAELADGHRTVARAAVDALSKVRGQAMVVVPLLDFLADESLTTKTTVQVLEIIASNVPSGVLDELNDKLTRATEASVRAVLVRAMIASQELDQAMAVLSVLETSSEPFEVRFALAQWLGERLTALPLDAGPRPAMVGVIESLLADADASVRAQAAKSLGESGDPRSAALLSERAKHEVSGSVLLDIVSALGQVGSLECAASIGWIQAHDTVSEGDALNERARAALRAIGRGRSWTEWVTMAQSLADAEAPALALVVINEVLAPRADGAVIEADVADRARGLKAVQLVAVGSTQDAHDLLLQLEEEGKAFPPREERLDLLAQTCRDLSLHSEAADWLALLLEGRGEADARFDELQRSLAGELLAARRHEEALALLSRLHAEQPGDNTLMLWFGQALMSAGRDDEARTILERLQSRVAEGDTAILDQTRLALEQLAAVAATNVGGEATAPEEQPEPAESTELTPSSVLTEGETDDQGAEAVPEADGEDGGNGGR